MGFKKVNLVTCDRCGSHDTFEDGKIFDVLPNWLLVDKVGYLCPECAEQYRRFMYNFMEGTEGYKLPKEWEPEKTYKNMMEEMGCAHK